VITVAVYGAVALIVKMDDIGLHLVENRHTAFEKKLGRGLLHAMPRLLALLSVVGTAAMLWVGGQIVIHGLHELGVHGPSDVVHAVQHLVEQATGALAGVLGWLTNAALSGVAGLVLGTMVAVVIHGVLKLKTGAEA
jgi:predicted DNA repair protein MutK